MSKNLRLVDKIAHFFLGVFFLFAATVLFDHWFARLLCGLISLLAFAEFVSSRCMIFERLGQCSLKEKMSARSLFLLGLACLQMVFAYEWWSGGWGKISTSAFVDGIGKTFSYFASKNPFPWYKDFLLGFASTNATLFAYAVQWSEFAIAIVLALSAGIIVYTRHEKNKRKALVAAVFALLGGALMNANFYFAAGWTSPSTKGTNVIMFWSQLILAYVWILSLEDRKDHQD